MGKDQELLEAARNGNIPVVEKILSQRAKRSGPLASLRRGPGANVQDSSGYSALHHAALNGHKEVVQLLLQHEASTNIVDQKGSSPLHLAAWTGNSDVVRLLLCNGPSIPNVNLTTKDNETALHCAAQYGHTGVVAQLLEAGCDPTVRNAREETPLDLAAQYGRLETVELLVQTHPELILPFTARGGARNRQFPHTPLHLASRNGHKAVVSVLLNAGMEVNVRTAAGTALHEAALCGKLEVARALLEGGVDLGARDAQRNTVMDLLGQFPPHVTHDIVALIHQHRSGLSESLMNRVGGGGEAGDGGGGCGGGGDAGDGAPLPPIPVPADPALGSPYENVRVAPRCRGGGGGGSVGGGVDGVSPGTSPTHWEFYHHHHHAQHGSDDCRGSGVSITSSEGVGPYLGGRLDGREGYGCEDREADRMSVSSTASSTGGPSPRERAGSSGRPDPSQSIYMPMGPGHGHSRSPGSNSKVSPTPPKKPPRRNLSVSPTHLQPGFLSVSSESSASTGAYEYLYLSRSGVRSHGDLELELEPVGGGGGGTARRDLRRGRSTDQYVDMRARPSALIEQGEAFQAYLNQRREELDFQQQAAAAAAATAAAGGASAYENVPLRTQNPRRKLRRHGADRSYEHHEPVYQLVPAGTADQPGAGTGASSSPASMATPAATPAAAPADDAGGTFVSSAYITLKSSQESLLEEEGQTGTGPRRAEDKRLRKAQAMATPLSPTHYQQPPTPDHPPPSALQAEKSIHERIRPLSQEYKRRSRDIETETEEDLLVFPSLDASSGSLSSSVSLSDKSVSTDNNVEEFFGDAPFAGLFKGSTSQSAELGVRSSPAERPKTLRRLKNVYEGGVGGGGGGGEDGGGGGVRLRDRDAAAAASAAAEKASLSILSPFDEQEEWNKISEIMASFGTGLVRESVFVTELEKEFQNRLGLTHAESGSTSSPLATSSVGHWLASLGLVEYEGLFARHGFDDLDFINGVLEDSDLRDMGVDSERDRTTILEACRALPATVRTAMAAAEAVEATQAAAAQRRAAAAAAAAAEGSSNGGSSNGGGEGTTPTTTADGVPAEDGAPTPQEQQGAEEVGEEEEEEEGAAVTAWLRALRLDCYADTFRKHIYTDMARVRRIWEVELTAVLEIARLGHRRRILASVGAAGGPPGLAALAPAAPAATTAPASSLRGPDLDDLTHDLNQLKTNIQQLKEEIREKMPSAVSSAPANGTGPPAGAGTTGTLRHSHKKSRPAPPPPGAPPPQPAPPPPPANGDLEIRGPSELLEGVPATLTTQWRHRPHVLVTGCVTYVANYLGSTVVKELRGTESTKKSIQKLKKSPKEAKTTPDIVLAISYRGVKFLNTLTQELVCEHEIRNIHCACQDADDLTHFAYITKDHASKSHYCHVFCVQTMDQATEIILTLGQAFEVAYQMALREQFSNACGGGAARRGPNGNGHARSQSASQAPASASGQLGVGSLGAAAAAAGHARSHSVNEIKLNGLAAREMSIESPAKSVPAPPAPIVLKEEL